MATIIGVLAVLGVEGDLLDRFIRDHPVQVAIAFGLAVFGVIVPLVVSAKIHAVRASILFVGAGAGLAIWWGAQGVGEREQPDIAVMPLAVDAETDQVSFQIEALGTHLRSRDRMLLRVSATSLRYPRDRCANAGFGTKGVEDVYWGESGPNLRGEASTTATVKVSSRLHHYMCAYAALTEQQGQHQGPPADAGGSRPEEGRSPNQDHEPVILDRSAQLAKPEYIEKVAKALDKVYDPPRGWLARRRAKGRRLVEAAELKDLKIVVMSDLHRGMGDKADDFRRSHRAYRAALGWYVEQGYALWLLGDVEELWENSPEQVICHYKEVLALEREFIGRGGLRRFYGNHDLDWSKPKTVRKYLDHWIGDTPIIESLRLEVTDDGKPLGTLFFVHGHQGTPGSDVFAPISRLAVCRLAGGPAVAGLDRDDAGRQR